jgi:hypothetical protein
MHLQHLIEAQLVLCSYCEAAHFGIDVLQELVSGMNLLANFIIYPYMIPDDMSQGGLNSVEILSITTSRRGEITKPEQDCHSYGYHTSVQGVELQ